MSSNLGLYSNSLSSTIPTQLGMLDQMTAGFYLNLNSFCGDLPTELASLTGNFDVQEVIDGNFIGSPCLRSSSTGGNTPGESNPTGGVTATMWVLGPGGLAIMVLGVLVAYKSRAANDDDDSSSSSRHSAPLLNSCKMPDLESNGGMQIELQTPPDQPNHLAHAWQSSSAQLVVLDHELRVVLWSKGMTKATSSFTPAPGTSIEGLPFRSTDARQRVVGALELIMRERGAEGETALHPTFALQAAVTTAPTVSLHLATVLSNGMHNEVLLSMTAIKMKPLSTVAPQGFENGPCHLLIMGLETFDPGLASLSYESKVTSLSTVSDLTSENETTGEMTTSSGTWEYTSDIDNNTEPDGWTLTGPTEMKGEGAVGSSTRPTGPKAAAAAVALAVMGVLGKHGPESGEDSTKDSRDTAYILEEHLLQVAGWAVSAAAGSKDPPPSCVVDSSGIPT
jgi:hypothetical protein